MSLLDYRTLMGDLHIDEHALLMSFSLSFDGFQFFRRFRGDSALISFCGDSWAAVRFRAVPMLCRG